MKFIVLFHPCALYTAFVVKWNGNFFGHIPNYAFLLHGKQFYLVKFTEEIFFIVIMFLYYCLASFCINIMLSKKPYTFPQPNPLSANRIYYLSLFSKHMMTCERKSIQLLHLKGILIIIITVITRNVKENWVNGHLWSFNGFLLNKWIRHDNNFNDI